MVLDKINEVNDIKKIPREDLPKLAEEIREFLIDHTSRNGGHLASNLGVVELTIALHLFLDLPKDKLIWDVGHQCYTHKILTGRKDLLEGMRKLGGLSGFPKRCESACDSFDTGHSSTSISAGLGYACAREVTGQDYKVVSVIGDGAMTGGLAYEGLNNAANLKKNYIIILNDNEMSISTNVGGMSDYLASVRTAESYAGLKEKVTSALKKVPGLGEQMVQTIHKTKSSIKQFFIPGMVFEELGLTYLGPVDGHNIGRVQKLLQEAAKVEGPVLVHVLTQKGRGYELAVRHPARFHGTNPFEIETGLPKKKSGPAYSDIFSTVMRKLGDRDERIVGVSAAMPTGTGLNRFAHMFPDRFYDVGIAESHAVTFAAGLALGGLKPVVAIYSTFLQRAVDLLLQDVCMQNLPVVFCIDRAGLVGSDGETHHGCFDLTYLSMMPNMTVMAPKNKWELSDMVKFAVKQDSPMAIRYPRGSAWDGLEDHRAPIEMGKAEMIYEGRDLMILAVGSMVKVACRVREELAGRKIEAGIVNVRFVKPLDKELLGQLANRYKRLVTMEENAEIGGYGERICGLSQEMGLDLDILRIAIPDHFVCHGSVDQLFEMLELDGPSISRRICSRWYSEGER